MLRGLPAGAGAILFSVLACGAGLVLLGLGLAPATTEALPFGLGLLVAGVVVGVPGYRSLRESFAPEAAEGAVVGQAPVASQPPASVACPNCGGPTPLRLAEPSHGACPHCQHRFALPAALAQVLTAAAALVKQQTEAERQLARSIQQLALAEEGWLRRLKKRASALVGVAALAGLYGLFSRASNSQWFAWLAFGLAASAWVLWLTRWARRHVPAYIRQIVGRWTALRLPGVAGLACRVCGAPLPEGGGVVLRCGYCSADNLASPEALTQLAAAAGHAVRGTLRVAQRQRRSDELGAFALLLVPALGLLGWFAAGAFAGSGFLRLGELRIWADGSARFFVVRAQRYGTPQACLAVTAADGDRTRLVFDFKHLPAVTAEALARASIREPVPPSWLVGREIDGKGTVTSVHRLLRFPTRHIAVFGSSDSKLYLPSDFGVLGGELTCLTGFDAGVGEVIDMQAK